MTKIKGEFDILTSPKAGQLTPSKLKDLIVQSLDDDKADNITIIDLKDKSEMADYMVIASGNSAKHITGLAQNLQKRLSVRGQENSRTEGLEKGDWVIADFGDVIIHLFRPEVREFYNLEKMWGAPIPRQTGSGFHLS